MFDGGVIVCARELYKSHNACCTVSMTLVTYERQDTIFMVKFHSNRQTTTCIVLCYFIIIFLILNMKVIAIMQHVISFNIFLLHILFI